MNLRYRVGVGAPLPTDVVAEIDRRFGPMRITQGLRVTVHGTVTDQAALRGLLTLLWDVNVDVISLRVGHVPGPDAGRAMDLPPRDDTLARHGDHPPGSAPTSRSR